MKGKWNRRDENSERGSAQGLTWTVKEWLGHESLATSRNLEGNREAVGGHEAPFFRTRTSEGHLAFSGPHLRTAGIYTGAVQTSTLQLSEVQV